LEYNQSFFIDLTWHRLMVSEIKHVLDAFKDERNK